MSGRMMPTFAPLPSRAPPPEALDEELSEDDVPPAGGAGGVVLSFFLLEAQALSTSEAATPATTRPIALLRMGCTAFRGTGDRLALCLRRSMNVVRVNISVRPPASTTSKPFRYRDCATPLPGIGRSSARPVEPVRAATEGRTA